MSSEAVKFPGFENVPSGFSAVFTPPGTFGSPAADDDNSLKKQLVLGLATNST